MENSNQLELIAKPTHIDAKHIDFKQQYSNLKIFGVMLVFFESLLVLALLGLMFIFV